jgi:hypothetical protein
LGALRRKGFVTGSSLLAAPSGKVTVTLSDREPMVNDSCPHGI